MLPPDGRAVLLEELRPPAGYTLDGAIATTFTLDLTAAVIPPLAFSSFATGSLPDPVTLLEAVRAAADRIDIFCQGGNIAIPHRAPDLLAFVEPMVHEVRRPPGHLFHPKVWFVRYVDVEEDVEAHRLLVLTRNLTHDRAWDVVVRLDSAGFSSRQLAENRELSRFLSDLPGRSITQLSGSRLERVEELAYAARYVVWEVPADARSVAFHYLDGRTRPDFKGRRHLVISPFLNDSGVDEVVPLGQKATMISRASELERLSSEQLGRLDTYVIDAMAGIADDDSEQSSDEAEPAPTRGLLSGLHAKLYVVEPWGRAERARVLIGSANATDAAFGGNVEFLVEIDGSRRLLGVDALMGEDGALRPLVQPYRAVGGAAPEPDEDERRDLENRLRVIAEIRHTVTVEPAESSTGDKGRHDLTITAGTTYPLDGGWTATVELLTLPGSALAAKSNQLLDDSLTGVETADISPFLSTRLTSPTGLQGGTVVLAELVGDPADRLDLVLARQIDTPEKFLRFLYLILSLGNPHLLAHLGQLNGPGDGTGLVRASGGPGVLELVLRALAEKPDALDDLGRLVERLSKTEEGRALLPPGFEELWSQAVRARRMLGRGR